MLLEVVVNADEAKLALSKAYNDEQVVDLRVYYLGDGEVLSGLLIVRRSTNHYTTFLVCIDY